MQTRMRRKIGRSGVAMLLVLTSLLLQGSVRADTRLTDEQMRMNRLTIGLLQRGQKINDVLDFVATLEGCWYHSIGCDDVYPAAKKVGLDTGNLGLDIEYAESPIGTWSIFESFGGASGTIIIDLSIRVGSCSCAFLGKATFPGGGTAQFGIYDGIRYDFDYTNNQGDHGVGYLEWSPSGCMLSGPFVSNVFKGANGFFNTGILVLRRC